MKRLIFALAIFFLVASNVYALDAIYDLKGPNVIRGWHVVAVDNDLSNAATLVTDEDTAYAQNATAQTMEIVSSEAGDTTQVVTIYGINASGKQIKESLVATGTTVAVTTQTFTYFDHAEIDAECAGTMTIQTVDNTDVTVIPIGSLASQVSQHFCGEKVSYISGWNATVNSTAACVNFTLRYYPDDADCLDPTDGFIVLDQIYIDDAATSPYSVQKTFAQPIRVAAGGYIAIYAIGDADNGSAIVTMQGFDILE